MRKNITPQTLQRLPMYLNYRKSLPKNSGNVNISATAIAEALNLNDVQVRKDLASVSKGGKPKVGYVTEELIGDIGQFLGFENKTGVIIAGVGNLGRALLAFDGFGDYGLNILAGFDENKNIAGTEINGKPVFSVSELKAFCKKENVKIGIITVPESAAQEICDIMVSSGITAIMNFAPVHLIAPESVTIKNENMAISLAMLSRNFQ